MKPNLLMTQKPVFAIQSWAEIQKSKGGTGKTVSQMHWHRLGAFMHGVWPKEPPPILFFEGEFECPDAGNGQDTKPETATDSACEEQSVRVPCTSTDWLTKPGTDLSDLDLRSTTDAETERAIGQTILKR